MKIISFIRKFELIKKKKLFIIALDTEDTIYIIYIVSFVNMN